jgi:transposase
VEFVPAVVDVGVPAPALGEEAKAPRRKSRPAIGMIEIEVDGVTIRIGRGADANMVAAVVLALKAPR